MALTLINTFSNTGNSDVDNIGLCVQDQRYGFDALSLTHMGDTTVPAIAAGSRIECNGALLEATSEEAISTTDPHTSATVADGTVYIMIDGTNRLAYFTATAPTWSDTKQGWYGLTTWANWKYLSYKMTKATAAYSSKQIFITRFQNSTTIDSTGIIFPSTIYGNITAFSKITMINGSCNSASNTIDFPVGYTSDNSLVLTAYINTAGGKQYCIGEADGITVGLYFNLATGKIILEQSSGGNATYHIYLMLQS